MHAAQKPKSKLKFVALDKDNCISTSGDEKTFYESAARKVWRRGTGYRCDYSSQKKVTIPVKKSQVAWHDPVSFFVNRFWGRRPDGVEFNEALQIAYILEFKRLTDRGRDEGFPG